MELPDPHAKYPLAAGMVKGAVDQEAQAGNVHAYVLLLMVPAEVCPPQTTRRPEMLPSPTPPRAWGRGTPATQPPAGVKDSVLLCGTNPRSSPPAEYAAVAVLVYPCHRKLVIISFPVSARSE